MQRCSPKLACSPSLIPDPNYSHNMREIYVSLEFIHKECYGI